MKKKQSQDTQVYECCLDNGGRVRCEAQDLDEAATVICKAWAGKATRPVLATLHEVG